MFAYGSANDFVFMQDSAPSHRAKTTDFLRNVVPDFIIAEVWAPDSSDLNPLDYSAWDILQELLYEGRREPYANLHELEKAIRQKWNEIDGQLLRLLITH